MGTSANSMEMGGFVSKIQRLCWFAKEDFDELESGRFFFSCFFFKFIFSQNGIPTELIFYESV